VEALLDDVRRAHMMITADALQGGAARQLHGLQGRPLRKKVAEEGGVVVVEPL
jgi:hypothetical protein